MPHVLGIARHHQHDWGLFARRGKSALARSRCFGFSRDQWSGSRRQGHCSEDERTVDSRSPTDATRKWLMIPSLEELGVLRLSVAERIVLAQEILDSVMAALGPQPLTDARRDELKRRVAEADGNPGAGV